MRIEFSETQISFDENAEKTYILVLGAPPEQFEIVDCGKQESRVISLGIRQDVHHLACLTYIWFMDSKKEKWNTYVTENG